MEQIIESNQKITNYIHQIILNIVTSQWQKNAKERLRIKYNSVGEEKSQHSMSND